MPTADIVIRLTGSSAATIDKRASSLDKLASSVARVRSHTGSSSTRLGNAANSARRYGASIDEAKKRTDAFGTTIRGSGNALDNFRTLFERMVRIMTAYFIISTATRLTREFLSLIVDAPAKMQLWNEQLAVLTGNATVAAERLKLLQEVAVETPLELPDLTEGLVALNAFNVEISEKTLPLIADLAAASGRTFESVSQVIGKVITGSAPAITRSLPVLGINPQEFKARAKEIGDNATALFQIIEEKFGGFAVRSSSTFLGIQSNISDAIFFIAAEIGRRVLPELSKVQGELFAFLNDLRSSPEKLEDVGLKLQGATRTLVGGARSATGALVETARAVGGLIDILGGLQSILEVLGVVIISRMVIGLAQALTAATPLGLAVTAISAAVLIMVARFNDARDPAEKLTLQLENMAAAMADVNDRFRENINLVDVARVGPIIATIASATAEADRIEEALAGVAPAAGVVSARRLAGSLMILTEGVDTNAAEGIREISNEIIRLSEAFTSDKTSLEDRSNILSRIQALSRAMTPLLATLGNHFVDIRDKAAAAAEEARKFIPTLLGEDEGGKDRFKKPEAFQSIFNRLVSSLAEAFTEITATTTRGPAVLGGFLEDLNARLLAGLIDEKQFRQELDMKISETKTFIKQAFESGDPVQVALAIKLGVFLEGLQNVAKRLDKEIRDPLTQAMESAIRTSVKQASDVLADALGSLLVPREGQSLGDILKRALAGVMNTLGDALITIGLGAQALQALITNIFSPPGAAAAIAAGLALKTFASAISNSLANSSSGTSRRSAGGGQGSGTINFPAFNPPPASQNQITIVAMDSKSFEDFLSDNANAVGKVAATIADRDRATRGAAFGAFVQPRTA